MQLKLNRLLLSTTTTAKAQHKIENVTVILVNSYYVVKTLCNQWSPVCMVLSMHGKHIIINTIPALP